MLPECRCSGEYLLDIPGNLTKPVRSLTISDAGIRNLAASSLQPYRRALRDFALMNVKYLSVIEEGVFHNLPRLRTIYINHAPLLVSIPDRVFQATLPNLKIIRMVHCGLQSPPHLTLLVTNRPLIMIDLESNRISRLRTGDIQVKAEQLLLNYNQIEAVERKAFGNSQIATLSLKGNRGLKYLHSEAFMDLKSLRYLDLSDTAITHLPTKGLQELDVLWLENTKSLKVFPSVFNFEYIREVHLTYSYHCCAFHFPARHDPLEYDKHVEFVKSLEKQCNNNGPDVLHTRKRRSWSEEPWNLTGDTWGRLSPAAPIKHPTSVDPFGVFHEQGNVISQIHAMCGNLTRNYRDVTCVPSPDAFNPCEDLMGNWGLRVAVWIVATAALFGNLAVLLVLLSSRFRMTVPKFLMCNLAVADLCMGAYLLMIAVMDARSMGDYFNYAIDWQNGAGCRIAGSLTVFACELSIFTLTVITIERWYTITYAIHLNRRLKLSTTAKIMAAGWLYAITMASLPLVGVSGYSKTSICLPLDNMKLLDITYLVLLLSFNCIAFLVICTCYSKMYCSIKGGQDAVAAVLRSDMTVAKRMALLVFTDFACWAPISFFGVTALSGYPLIDVTKTKFLLVFFYPLNSCANPYLYALLTQQYRRDLFVLLSRYGICSKRAARYKGTGVVQRGGTVEDKNRSQRVVGPSHRGSLLTTVTSVDCGTPNTRPGSLTAVPEFSVQMQQVLTHNHHPTQPDKESSFL